VRIRYLLNVQHFAEAEACARASAVEKKELLNGARNAFPMAAE
jgi:hypothetical protein